MEFYTFVKSYGKTILYRGIEQDKRIIRRVKSEGYRPRLYVKSKDGNAQSIFGDRLKELDFNSIADAKNFIELEKDVQHSVYGMTQFHYAFISDKFTQDIDYDSTLIRVFFIDIETKIGTEGFESPTFARQPITAITLYDSFSKLFISFSQKNDKPPQISSKNREIRFFTNEEDMLLSFIAYWKMNWCDIISGWNSEFYDLPYLTKRISLLFGEEILNSLSPFNVVRERTVENMGRQQTKVEILGITSLDYLDVYKKFTYSVQESYKLNHIALMELGEEKLDYSEYTNLNDLYERNFDRFVEYNIHDVELLVALNEKTKFLDIIYQLTYAAKCNFEDALGTVRIWDVYIYNQVRKKGLVIPPEKISKKEGTFAGAFVKEPKKGFYKWIITFDAASLYPSLIRQFNMSPETLVPQTEPVYDQCKIPLYHLILEKLVNEKYDLSWTKEAKVGCTASGALFYNDREGILPPIVANVIDGRKIAKTEMLKKEQEREYEIDEEKKRILTQQIVALNGKQMALKILNNSLYGAIGNPAFRYYKLEIAEAITLSGQWCIRWLEKRINDYLMTLFGENEETRQDRIITIDTDSVFVNLEEFVKRIDKKENIAEEKLVSIIDEFCKKMLQPFIDQCMKNFVQYSNAKEHRVFFKREKIANAGIFLAKKRYILSVWNSEGVTYTAPKLKVMGIDLIKSAYPEVCRKASKKFIPLVLTREKEKLLNEIKKLREQFFSAPAIDIAFPRGVQGIKKYETANYGYGKGTPIHVRASILYNGLLEKYKLNQRYEKIFDGDKIKFIHLMMPNPIQQNVIGFKDTLPVEFKLNDYIDREMQFRKSFLDPFSSLTEVLGWNIDTQRATLDDFFN